MYNHIPVNVVSVFLFNSWLLLSFRVKENPIVSLHRLRVTNLLLLFRIMRFLINLFIGVFCIRLSYCFHTHSCAMDSFIYEKKNVYNCFVCVSVCMQCYKCTLGWWKTCTQQQTKQNKKEKMKKSKMIKMTNTSEINIFTCINGCYAPYIDFGVYIQH